mmetsp:Transcript_31799/g.84935  ORF Transcript_31799/g.84935 Transcript_31799/m.84935 type:complete len:220 (+) Transcript_31799:126-785(+)
MLTVTGLWLSIWRLRLQLSLLLVLRWRCGLGDLGGRTSNLERSLSIPISCPSSASLESVSRCGGAHQGNQPLPDKLNQLMRTFSSTKHWLDDVQMRWFPLRTARSAEGRLLSRGRQSPRVRGIQLWMQMPYLTRPWLDDVQVRWFLVSRTRLRGDRLLSRGEAPIVLGCPSWMRMPSSMRRWLDDNRRRRPITGCHGRRPLSRDFGQSCEVSWTNLPNM